MRESVYFINSANGKKKTPDIINDLKKADAIVCEGGKQTKEIARQKQIIKKMHMPIWYRPKVGFLNQRF